MVNGIDVPSAAQQVKKALLDTNQIVTLVILLAYIGFLIGFIGLSGFEANEKWYELVKLGFTTLGSALTLVLGYYFGQKEVSAIKEKEAVQDELKTVKADKTSAVSGLIERFGSASTPSQPEDLASATKRQKGRPKKDGE